EPETVTVTPGSIPPEASVARPKICPVSTWPNALVAATNIKRAAQKRTFDMIGDLVNDFSPALIHARVAVETACYNTLGGSLTTAGSGFYISVHLLQLSHIESRSGVRSAGYPTIVSRN
ncbi:MAG TPA: hypothetical protein VEK56_14135, partial [Vicinamibacterales bacterium]|nr:hypothetical protein [Vicinamibacterales bacterium]